MTDDTQFVAIDFETTGTVEGYPTEPWQIGMVFMRGGRVEGQYRFQSLLHVGDRPFNPYAPGRHTSVRGELLVAPTLHDLWGQLEPWLGGRPLVAHSTATERKMLGEAFPLHPFGPWIDTLDLVRVAYPGLENHKLEDVVPRLGLQERVMEIAPDLGPHDAFYDAVACAVLLEHLLGLEGWQGLALASLTNAKSRALLRIQAARNDASLHRK
ncbi:MAG: 3'-5' exonuclease [Lentisphaeria bacterium]|nr:3'-5' exonuclease [Lentisphaeria bacterium]